MVSAKKGNYLAYFPSYQYLEKEAEVFSKLYPDIRLICQSPQMDDQELSLIHILPAVIAGLRVSIITYLAREVIRSLLIGLRLYGIARCV